MYNITTLQWCFHFPPTKAVHGQHAHGHDGHGEAEQEAAVLSLRDLGHEDLVLGQVAV